MVMNEQEDVQWIGNTLTWAMTATVKGQKRKKTATTYRFVRSVSLTLLHGHGRHISFVLLLWGKGAMDVVSAASLFLGRPTNCNSYLTTW